VEQRQLGKTGIKISPLVFGGNVFGWTIDEPMSFTLLDAFVDAGFNCIDTANVYSNWKPGNKGGESETIIGNWLKRSGKRDKVVIATKVGHDMGPMGKGLAREYILKEVEQSLTRLQTDYIDLYQSHVDDKDTPFDETLSAYEKLIAQGKVRAIGTSNYTGERLAQSLKVSAEHKLPVYQTLQPLYNLYDRRPYESDLEPICIENGLGVIPYFSLASGFLTGKYRSEADIAGRPRSARLSKYFNDRGTRILKVLDTVASQVDSTPAAVALAWMLARPSITAPIASATNLDQLKVLVSAIQLKLDQGQIEFLNVESA
jgi:aryl-alcohol dehydrogenase-like predicted oxidoreductase